MGGKGESTMREGIREGTAKSKGLFEGSMEL